MNNKNIIKFLEVKIEEVKKKRTKMLRKDSWRYIAEPVGLMTIIEYLKEQILILQEK